MDTQTFLDEEKQLHFLQELLKNDTKLTLLQAIKHLEAFIQSSLSVNS